MCGLLKWGHSVCTSIVHCEYKYSTEYKSTVQYENVSDLLLADRSHTFCWVRTTYVESSQSPVSDGASHCTRSQSAPIAATASCCGSLGTSARRDATGVTDRNRTGREGTGRGGGLASTPEQTQCTCTRMEYALVTWLIVSDSWSSRCSLLFSRICIRFTATCAVQVHHCWPLLLLTSGNRTVYSPASALLTRSTCSANRESEQLVDILRPSISSSYHLNVNCPMLALAWD